MDTAQNPLLCLVPEKSDYPNAVPDVVKKAHECRCAIAFLACSAKEPGVGTVAVDGGHAPGYRAPHRWRPVAATTAAGQALGAQGAQFVVENALQPDAAFA